MVATKQQDGETIHQLEEKLHRLRVNDKVLKSFKRDHTGRGNNKPVKAIKRDDMGNMIVKTPKVSSAEQIQLHEDVQQICNPHDTLNNRKAVLFPVMGDIETTAYLDTDSVPVQYPAGTDATAGLLSSQTCGILYNDYVRNTITYSTLPVYSGPVGQSPTYRYDAQFTPVLDSSNNYIKTQIPVNNVRLNVVAGLPVDLPIAYLRGNTSNSLLPHGSFLPVGQSDRFGGSWIYVDDRATLGMSCTNNTGAALDCSAIIYKYTPGGPTRVSSISFGSVASAATSYQGWINDNAGDGYYMIKIISLNATLNSVFTFTLSVSNYNTNTNAFSGQTHCWQHLPAPGFQAVAPLMEMVRLNGTVLEYHNVGSVTNGEIYCAQFAGQDWLDIATSGFATIFSQSKDNSFSQSGETPQGALVRLNFGGGKDALDLKQQHKHQNGALTSVFFSLDNPGAFCVIFSNIALGNLGSPQNAVWKRGCHMQFQTTDTTRSPGVSTMSRQHFRAVVTIASQVPYFGPNEFHWSDVRDWISNVIDKAVKVAPMVSGLLAVL